MINEYIDSNKTIYGISLYMLTVTVPKEEKDNKKDKYSHVIFIGKVTKLDE